MVERATIAIVGNTFPVREELRAMGCEWDRRAQLWYAPKSQAEAAQKLVSSRRCRKQKNPAGQQSLK
ncbi:MAG TPA: hypothetical protein PLU95_09290 [Syntrophales bacterium]|jgi:hypothetical protein|nr:hypothetical protein [Syntrophorhabdaceae bacterium]HPN09482.1 hypothetical protein [Syntrophales bacterium]